MHGGGYGGPGGPGFGGGRGAGGSGFPPAEGQAAASMPQGGAGTANNGPVAGSNGWLMYIDHESGDAYYHHPETGTTQWEAPPEWNRGGGQ